MALKIEQSVGPALDDPSYVHFTPLDPQCVEPTDLFTQNPDLIAPQVPASQVTAGLWKSLPSLAEIPSQSINEDVTALDLMKASPEELVAYATAHHDKEYEKGLKYAEAVLAQNVDYDLKNTLGALPERLQHILEPLVDEGLTFSFEKEESDNSNPFAPQMEDVASAGGLMLVIKKPADLVMRGLRGTKNVAFNTFNKGPEVILKISLGVGAAVVVYAALDHMYEGINHWTGDRLPPVLKGPAMFGMGIGGVEAVRGFGQATKLYSMARPDYIGAIKSLPGFYLTQKGMGAVLDKVMPGHVFDRGTLANELGAFGGSLVAYRQIKNVYAATLSRLNNFVARSTLSSGKIGLDAGMGVAGKELAEFGVGTGLKMGASMGVKVAGVAVKGLGWLGKAATVVGVVSIVTDIFYLGRDTSDNPHAKLEAQLWHDKLDEEHWWITTALFGSMIRASTPNSSIEQPKQKMMDQTANFSLWMHQNVKDLVLKNYHDGKLDATGLEQDLTAFNYKVVTSEDGSDMKNDDDSKMTNADLIKNNLAQMDLLKVEKEEFKGLYSKLKSMTDDNGRIISSSPVFSEIAKVGVDEELSITRQVLGKALLDLQLVELNPDGTPALDIAGKMVGKKIPKSQLKGEQKHFLLGADEQTSPKAELDAHIAQLERLSQALAPQI